MNHSFRCDSNRSVKWPIATLPSFDDSCYKGLLVGWLASKHYFQGIQDGHMPFWKNWKAKRSLNSSELQSLNISQYLSMLKSIKSIQKSVYFAPGGALRCESEQVRLTVV